MHLRRLVLRPQLGDLLQMAGQVWRDGGVGCEEAEGAGGRECKAQEDADQANDGGVRNEGDAGKKFLRPGAWRRAVDCAMTPAATGLRFWSGR